MLRPHHPARERVTAALAIQCPIIMPLSKAMASGFDFVLILSRVVTALSKQLPSIKPMDH